MYTEDDEKVTVKKDNSNIKYSDFYTSFNDIDKEDSKNKKKKKKKPSKENIVVKEEQDYNDFYGNNDSEIESNNNNRKIIVRIILAVVLFIILIVLVILLFVKGNNKVDGDIEISNNNITLKVGETSYISYKVVDTQSKVTTKFISSNSSVIVVNDSGEITALQEGEAVITIRYTIDDVIREKQCLVKVSNNESINQNITLNLNISGGKDNTWTNSDVVITPEASSIFGITSLRYAINCDSNCSYSDALNKKVTVSSSGITKVKVEAKDKKNQEITKEITIKIDKDAPSVKLNSDRNITSNKDVEVCATCSDSLSGCKQTKVCKKYTSSKSNQVITVYDMAGNKKDSPTFNVTINKTTAPCSLKVSSSGVVTATLREEAVYYGFNSKYTGTNELSKQISINASKSGESGAKVVYYYVKNKNGTGGKCYITVIKKCSCKDSSSTDPNCSAVCTFSSQ